MHFLKDKLALDLLDNSTMTEGITKHFAKFRVAIKLFRANEKPQFSQVYSFGNFTNFVKT